ncbi:DUF4278 domain-containing protein [Phormidium sp. CCY1219]|uniref:DUF4278 domain-containing protein n=1 Tax=Phormidium sp. CCY1219 TaxID=2886104 RepID=UPI002D1F100E|nr:DUF4278 domain-containing protein [Phormidium sp. CCY1219]MEB3827268.1 DUF4278 domain-containing protein [Phormidium sp. CCY1219]
MKLSYRGTPYDYEPPTLDMMEGETGGQYRGNAWHPRYPRHIPMPQPLHQLKYRGSTYSTGESVETAKPATAPPVAAEAMAIDSEGDRLGEEVAKLHRTNICRSLERRLQAARIQGDEHLIALLESESNQLTCSWH